MALDASAKVISLSEIAPAPAWIILQETSSFPRLRRPSFIASEEP
jgi:hypothetical protein